MVLNVNLPNNAYDIVMEKGALARAGEWLELNRRCLIVTDDGVPAEYANSIAALCADPTLVVLPQGEESKCLKNFEKLCAIMLEKGFTRKDCAIAVGGGVVGDLTGFSTACYMRGIDFYNVPTTLLSQVDSSVGGKTAVDFGGVKNIIGAFYQPKKVIIDPGVLSTLPPRHLSAGLAEALKMGLTSDKELYGLFKTQSLDIEKVIELALKVKISVVEQDEKEQGLRRILNFGHTLGHGIEALQPKDGLYHGECVALGMIPMCGKALRTELVGILKALKLPTVPNVDLEKALVLAAHDKKCVEKGVLAVRVEKAGEYIIENMPLEEWKQLIRDNMEI